MHIWMKYVHVCMCFYMYMNHVYCINAIFYMKPQDFVHLYMLVCAFIFPHIVFWDIFPWLRGRLRIKPQGLRRKGRGTSQRTNVQVPLFPIWEQHLLLTQR